MENVINLPMDRPRSGGLTAHVALFAVVTALLAALDWSTPGPYWVQWVALGWGTGVLLHAFLAQRR